jgi:diguanylate cyclase (GGDEF)-like protein
MPPVVVPRAAPQDLPTPVRARGVRTFLLLVLGALAAIDAVIESANANWAVAVPTAVVALLTPFVLHLARRERFAWLPEWYGLVILGVFLVFGGLTQWHHPANLVWFPLYPFAFYFLGGLRAGTWLSSLGLLWLIGSYIAYAPLQHTQPVPFMQAVQVLFAFTMSAVIAYFYERTRTRQQQLLHEQAAADYLTGLPNRRGFFQVADTIAEQAKRLSHSFSIVLFDVDNFKTVNDRYGHDAGDRLLQDIARHVQGGVRRGDVLARWGGEEFIILLPQCNLESAAGLAEKLRADIATHAFATVGPVTASFGVAESAPLEDINNLISRADRALYRAKHAGKNRVDKEAG